MKRVNKQLVKASVSEQLKEGEEGQADEVKKGEVEVVEEEEACVCD